MLRFCDPYLPVHVEAVGPDRRFGLGCRALARDYCRFTGCLPIARNRELTGAAIRREHVADLSQRGRIAAPTMCAEVALSASRKISPGDVAKETRHFGRRN